MLNKYVQFFRDNGFFAGSKIKVTVTDITYIGKELVLSKGNNVIQSITIPASGKVEFFTDDSGELTVSSDNGTAVISGTVNVTNYATYNVTLDGAGSDTERQAYANDIVMDNETAVVNIAYTGDKSNISVVVSDPSLVSAKIDNNKITLRDAGKNKSGECSITATVESTSKYDSADVTFNVNKLTGIYGNWEDSSDEKIASMISKADAGEINLGDFWNVGDIRKITLNAISEGTDKIVNQPEQEIELVLQHLSVADSKYSLTEPTIGNRTHPNFVVGLKDCLENLTYISYVTDTITLTHSSYGTETYPVALPFEKTATSELEAWLNDNFYNAIPSYLRGCLKSVDVRFCGLNMGDMVGEYSETGNGTVNGAKSMKICLPSIYEILEDIIDIKTNTSNNYFTCTGDSLFDNSNNVYLRFGDCVEDAAQLANRTLNPSYEGSRFDYYANGNRIKKRGTLGEATPYLTRSYGAFKFCNFYSSSSHYVAKASRNALVKSDGTVGTFDNVSADSRDISRGISPIMFI